MTGLPREYKENLIRYEERRQAPIDSDIKILSSQSEYNYSQIRVPFSTLYQYYENTPQVKLAVDTYVDLITGTGLSFNCSNPRMKALIDKYINDTDMYQKIREITNTLLITGNALVEVLGDYDNFEEIDITTIIKKQRNQYGKVEYYDQRIVGDFGEEDIRLNPNNLKIIEMNIGISSRRPWGLSLFYPLAVPRVVGRRVYPSLIETMWKLEGDMAKIFGTYASPTNIWYYEGASMEDIDRYTNQLKKMKAGDSIITQKKPEIQTVEVSPNSKFDRYVEHFEKLLEIGTGFSTEFFTGGMSARSSSESTLNLLSKKVRAVQEVVIKIITTELIIPVLQKNYRDAMIENADIKLGFEAQNMVYLTTTDVQAAVTGGVFTVDEARNWYKRHGVELENAIPDAPVEPEVPTMTPDDIIRQIMGDPRQDTSDGQNTNDVTGKEIKE